MLCYMYAVCMCTFTGEERYLAAAIQAGETVWSRGLLKKGPGTYYFSITLYYTRLYYTILYYATMLNNNIVCYYALLCCAMLYAMQCYAMQCYAMLCCTTL
jgi:hypothetical protein